MMSFKQWIVLLCILVTYLLLGASFYHQIESREEIKRRRVELREMQAIEVLLEIHYHPSPNATQEEIFKRLTTYCGKPMHSNMSQTDLPLKWDYYHSLFFVITVVSTIGYGNLAPTTMFGRIFMIFYGLVGIPINGIVMVTLGEFFAKNFRKLHKRWKKTSKINHFSHRAGLIGNITLYLIPGFTFFIFLPSVIMMLFEGWDYDVAVYYAFVTLTTIGFGDFVAGTQENEWGEGLYIAYKIFLLVWIIVGLGYVVMVMGFISSGLRHKKVHELEHVLSQNIKSTSTLMLRNLKGLLNQLILDRHIQPVYKPKKRSIAYHNWFNDKAYSLPDLTLIYDDDDGFDEPMRRTKSESELMDIDKEETFRTKQKDLLSKIETFKSLLPADIARGINLFSDKEILETERRLSTLSMAYIDYDYSTTPSMKPKKFSLVPVALNENEVTWCGQTAAIKEQEMREYLKYGRPRSRTLPVQQEPLIDVQTSRGLFSRIKNRLVPSSSSKDASKEKDIEKQEIYGPSNNKGAARISPCRNRAQSESVNILPKSVQEQEYQEVINLLLAFAHLPIPARNASGESLTNGDNNLTPNRCRRNAIRPMASRRASLAPTSPGPQTRRYSLMPPSQQDNGLHPPPYSPMIERPRRFSRPALNVSSTPSPVQRQRKKYASKDVIEEKT